MRYKLKGSTLASIRLRNLLMRANVKRLLSVVQANEVLDFEPNKRKSNRLGVECALDGKFESVLHCFGGSY